MSEVWVSVNLTYIDSSWEYFGIFLDLIIGLSTLSSFFLLIRFYSFIYVPVYTLEFNISFLSFYHKISSYFIYAISSSPFLYFFFFFVKVLCHLQLLLSNLFLFMGTNGLDTFEYLINSSLFHFKIVFLILPHFI